MRTAAQVDTSGHAQAQSGMLHGNTSRNTGQIITTLPDLILNGGLYREQYQNSFNLGIGISPNYACSTGQIITTSPKFVVHVEHDPDLA